jgi:hypothetical protein
MAGAFSALVPIALAVLVAVMGVFGGLSYEFYTARAGWTELAFFVAIVAAFVALMRGLRGFFGKYSGRLVFGLWLIATLGAYFGFLAHAPDGRGGY